MEFEVKPAKETAIFLIYTRKTGRTTLRGSGSECADGSYQVKTLTWFSRKSPVRL